MRLAKALPARCLPMLALGIISTVLVLIFILDQLPYHQPLWLTLVTWLGGSAGLLLVLSSRPFVRRAPRLADGLSLVALVLFLIVAVANVIWLIAAVIAFVADLF